MKKAVTSLVILLSLGILSSCRFVNSILHEDEIVAKVGSNVLYRTEVTKLIPDGVSSEDSLRLAMQYINSWASEMVFVDVAVRQLPKNDRDVSKELESYRRSLLKYRYEQHYVNERLDTAVTESEIKAYYQGHKQDFVLDRPIVKVRYVKLSSDEENIKELKDMLSTLDEDPSWDIESIDYSISDTYTDFGGDWIDLAILAKAMGVAYQDLPKIEEGSFIQIEDEIGRTNLAYISETVGENDVPPVEYCSERIAEIIINIRKHRLTTSLEQDLLSDARDKGKFVIY